MRKMKAAVLCAAIFALSAKAAPADDPAKIFGDQLKMVEGEFIPLAEAMPAAKYNFAPTKGEFRGVRTFAQQVKHVASVIYIVAAALKQEKPPVDTGGEAGPANLKTKEQIVKYAKDAFAYAHSAVATLTAANLLGEIPGPFGGKSSRLSIATTLAWHTFDHYGQMAVYLRMNGLVPPASRK